MSLPHKSTHKTFAPRETRLARTPFVRKAGSKRPKRNFTGLRSVGNNAHSKDWRREWPGLKRDLERAGITRCEECGSGEGLTPAHSLKRRFITSRPQMREVAILCLNCHRRCDEGMSHEEMVRHIRRLIAGRSDRLTEVA